MSKKDEALKRALEALEEINRLSIGENAICLPAEIDTAMDAIREALAEQPAYRAVKTFHEGKPVYVAEQPAQQGPVEWLTGCPECGMDGGCGCDSETWNPPAQQEEKPTTREEILGMAREAGVFETRYNPVVYSATPEALELFAALVAAHVRETERKPWVGLTDEDDVVGMARDAFAARYCALPVSEGRIKALAEAIEAKLKEKNA